MTRGFVTIATGDERYYRMARTLLRSCRQNCSEPERFAIIADRHNEYTAEFDNVVILDNPSNSWMDKLSLLQKCPYHENLFIDADCLVYRDINFFWDLYANADDFSCFGKALPLDSKDGWFTNQAAEVYPIRFCTHLHGMLYFIRKGEVVDRMYELCQNIISNYHAVTFKGFNDRLADEPVFALAMAVLDLKPVDRKPEYYCFVPFATRICTDYTSRRVNFENPKDGEVDACCVVHWGNQNTLKAPYRFDAHACNYAQREAQSQSYIWFMYQTKALLHWFRMQDNVDALCKWVKWFFGRLSHKLRKVLGKG